MLLCRGRGGGTGAEAEPPCSLLAVTVSLPGTARVKTKPKKKTKPQHKPAGMPEEED